MNFEIADVEFQILNPKKQKFVSWPAPDFKGFAQLQIVFENGHFQVQVFKDKNLSKKSPKVGSFFT